jgi:hypothetical protein
MDFAVLFLSLMVGNKGESTHDNLLPKHNTLNDDLSAVWFFDDKVAHYYESNRGRTTRHSMGKYQEEFSLTHREE